MNTYSAERIARGVLEALQVRDNSKMPVAAGKRRWYGLTRRQAASLVCEGDETLAMLVDMMISDYIDKQGIMWAQMVLQIEDFAPSPRRKIAPSNAPIEPS